MTEDVRFAAGVGFFIVGTTALALALAMWFNSAQCYSKARAMNLRATWGPLQDCMVETKAGVLPISRYKYIIDIESSK